MSSRSSSQHPASHQVRSSQLWFVVIQAFQQPAGMAADKQAAEVAQPAAI
jgi:hypothetical protein